MIRRTPGIYLSGNGISRTRQRQSGITTFVGITLKGPHHDPQEIQSWDEFVTIFGAVIDYGYLPSCVYNFFQNGGERCFVIRVLREPQPVDPALPPSVQDRLAIATTNVPVIDHNGDRCMKLAAINYGAWGNQMEVTIVRDSQSDMEITTLKNSVTSGSSHLAVKAVADFYPGCRGKIVSAENPFLHRVFQVQSINKSGRILALTAPVGIDFPRGSPLFGAGYSMTVTLADMREEFVNLSMDPDHPRFFESIINGTGQYGEHRDNGHSLLISAHALQDLSGQPFFRPQEMHLICTGGGDGFTHAGVVLTDDSLVGSLRIFSRERGRKGEGLRIETIPWESSLAFDSGIGDQLILESVDKLSVNDTIILHDDGAAISETRTVMFIDPDSHRITVDPATTHLFPRGSRVELADRFNVRVYLPNARTPVESIVNVGMNSADADHYVENVVNSKSRFIIAQVVGVNPPRDSAILRNGRDPGEIDADYYIGFDTAGGSLASSMPEFASRLGLAGDQDNSLPDSIALPDLIRSPIQFPGQRVQQWQRIINYAAGKGDRIVIMDPDKGQDMNDIVFLANALAKSHQCRYAALYFPLLNSITPGGDTLVPPSGAIAGLLRRVDQTEGIGRAPANFVLKGIFSVEKDIDPFDQAILNQIGINCIRSVNPGWIHLLGARTLNPDRRYLYLHNRRILNSLYKTLEQELLWAVFETNGPALQEKIKTTIKTKLHHMVRIGLTASGNPQQDFYIRCNEENNTNDTIESGIVLAEIGLALGKPAEFIEITLRRNPETITLTESDL